MDRTTLIRRIVIRLIACLVMAAFLFLPAVLAHADEDEVQVDNGIPVVYLDIDETRGTIQDMISSVDHDVYCYGTIRIDVPAGFRYSDFPDRVLQSIDGMEMSIRGRGNSTWNKEKKPYKIKLDKKTEVLGMAKNKHWVLVANVEDPSFLRDRVTAWLGDQMGFSFTPRGVPVDLVMTGQNFGTKYLGSYYLSENVRVDENRLEIAELLEDDTDPDIITGGYLVQNGIQVKDGSPDKFFTSRGANWSTHTPSFDPEDNALQTTPKDGAEGEEGPEEAFTGTELGDGYKNPAQQKYIQDYIQHFEDVLFEEGTAYRDMMDMESAAKYWLVNIVSLNGDAFATGSTYIYKDRDTQEGVSKLYWGPLWDFDFAWDYRYTTAGFECGHDWSKPMLYDTGEGGFVEALHKYWPEMKAALEELTRDGGIIDQYYEETKASAMADAEIWRKGQDFDYHDKVEHLKNWIKDRTKWVDEHFSEIDHLVHKVTYMSDGKVFATLYKSEKETIDGDEVEPEKEGYTFLGWVDEDGNDVAFPMDCTEDRTFTAKYVADSEITHGKDIAFQKASDIVNYSPFFSVYSIQYAVLPLDAEDRKITWTSSDELLATVSDLGVVHFTGTGEVTITAKLKLGNTRTFTLTITRDDLPNPECISPDEGTIRMIVGDQSPFSINTSPSPAKISDYTYESENENVVTVGDLGVLTAVGPGRTRVFVYVKSKNEKGEDITLKTYTTVIVSDGITPMEEDVTKETREADEPHTAESLGEKETQLEGTSIGTRPPLTGQQWIWIFLGIAAFALLMAVVAAIISAIRNH